MARKLPALFLILHLVLGSLTPPVRAAGTLDLKPANPSAGDVVTVSGVSAANTWVAVKFVDSGGSIMVFDAVKSDGAGAYTCSVKLPSACTGTLKVLAGYGANVAAADLAVSGPAPVSHTVSVSASPSVGGTVSGGGIYNSGASVTVNAAAHSGYRFVNWSEGGVPVGTGTSYVFTMGSADRTLAANFALLSNTGGNGGSTGGSNGSLTPPPVISKAQDEAKPFFKDIQGHWAEQNIMQMLPRGIIEGYPDGSFQPDQSVSRAEFTVLLVKAFKREAPNDPAFPDTINHWARESIASAAAAGIVKGYSSERFGPDDLITREQMAVMLVKAAQLAELNGESSFSDNAMIAPWAKGSVLSAVKSGIIKGYPDNSFRPQGQATRAEAVTVIVNTMK
ncbi:MAG: S-layer homology domain-containing protein [Syntrophomonas sp.]